VIQFEEFLPWFQEAAAKKMYALDPTLLEAEVSIWRGGDRGGEEEEEFSNNCTNDLKRHAQRETD